MLPALVGSVAGVYLTAKGIDSARYWYDYHKNTGKYPRYPFLRGYGGMSDFNNAFGKLRKL